MKLNLTILLCFYLSFKRSFAQVSISEYTHQDRPHYKVVTSTATYLFDRDGGGFSSIFDKEGLDWISYNKDSTVATYPKSAAGQFRGLPNAVFGNQDGGCGHPGFDKAISEKTAANVISTKSKSGLWEWSWTFYDTYAIWNVTKTDPNYFYWLLYEGTIAGSWNDINDKYWGSDKLLSGKVNDFYKNQSISDLHNWTFFGDKKVNRVLFVAQKNPDEIYDIVGFLGNQEEGMTQSPDGMIVAGLGRNKRGKPTMNQANSFMIGFFESKVITKKQHNKLKKRIENNKY
jgi:hypothetical protein